MNIHLYFQHLFMLDSFFYLLWNIIVEEVDGVKALDRNLRKTM